MNVVSYTHYCISPRLWPDIQNKRINIEQFLSPSHDHHFQHCRPSTPAGATACSSVTQYIDVQFCYESSMVFSKYLSRYLFSLSLTQVSSPKCQSIFSVTFIIIDNLRVDSPCVCDQTSVYPLQPRQVEIFSSLLLCLEDLKAKCLLQLQHLWILFFSMHVKRSHLDLCILPERIL